MRRETENEKNTLFALAALLLAAVLLAGCTPKVNIRPNEAAAPELTTYDNGYISMTVPAGRSVTTIGDCSHYTVRVCDPDEPARQIFYNLKTEGYNKSVQAQQFFSTYYPGGFGELPVISEYTADCFFTAAFSRLGPLNNTESFTFPVVNDFLVTENFGATAFGGDLLRATFTNENGAACDGLFTATVTDVGSYYVNSNPFDLSSPKIDTYPLAVYNTIFISAPEGEFIDCEGYLNECISSLQFSDAFVQQFYAEQGAVLAQVQANMRVNAEISDMIMDSWQRRSASYDVTSQKRSDATLGYERVYDTESGEVYRAYSGFTDDYTGERYQPVTDDMYTEAVDGYIEK